MIPKVIHYVWVGPRALGRMQRRCIASWKKHLPEYEVKCWNEQSIPEVVLQHPYVRTMYAQKKWAFVSDFVRFWALAQEGGIYLDTDEEVLKSLDRFLDNGAFFGRTSSDGYISAGIIGAQPGNAFIKEVFAEYDKRTGMEGLTTSPQMITAVYERFGGRPDVAVYPPEYFYPCNAGEACTPERMRHAFATHHWAESWVRFAGLRKMLRRLGVARLLKRLLRSL